VKACPTMASMACMTGKIKFNTEEQYTQYLDYLNEKEDVEYSEDERTGSRNRFFS